MDQVADHNVELFERHRVEVRPLFQRLPLHRRRDDRAQGGNDDDERKRAVDIQQRDHAGDQHQNAVRELKTGTLSVSLKISRLVWLFGKLHHSGYFFLVTYNLRE